jgi:hypothetical protein
MNYNALATKPLTEPEQARVERVCAQFTLELLDDTVKECNKTPDLIVDLLELLLKKQ